MTLFNLLTDNSLVFYSLFTGTVGFMGYKFAPSYLNSFYVDQGVQTIVNPMFGKDWNSIIEYINNKPSFFFDTSCCDTWIIPDPSVLIAISNSPFWPPF